LYPVVLVYGVTVAERHPYLPKLPHLPLFIAFRYPSPMEVPNRKTLPHAIPLWVDPQKEIYFVSVNCEKRFQNQLALPDIAERLFETVRHRQEKFLWWPHLFLLMPDHLHALLSFPPSRKPVKRIITKWKEWTAKELGLKWQRDFFEHRLRNEESRREKATYILENPVRKNLVTRPEDWPYIYFGSGECPKFET
jgi:putative transposase